MSTQTPIASITLSASTSSVTFANIPQTYTDLVIVISGVSSAANELRYRFNSDSGSNYSFTQLYGDGSSAGSSRDSNRTYGRIGSTRTTQNVHIGQIQNYSNSTTFKSVLSRESTADSIVQAFVGLWRSTAAITSIEFTPETGTFSSGMTFNLYGISTANINTGKAIGGDNVYSDGSYWYHVFNSSGTFTPTAALTADYLVVAGGGGGPINQSGGGAGGGAGGLRSTVTATGGGGSLESPLSLTAQAYTVTVGAGGAVGSVGVGNNGSNSVFSTITSTGGGGGGAYSPTAGQRNGGNGGSGGGAAPTTGTAGTGTANQGYAGGAYGSDAGGGGGGAGAVGAAASSAGGAGGAGVATSITGSSVTYAGGGGGGSYNSTGGTGGSGGGGNGSGNGGAAGTAGGTNTGGGGGGDGRTTGGFAGGSGIVIIRYAV
jgi:hypothetical protein